MQSLADRDRLLSKCRLGARLGGLVGVCVGLLVLVGGWLCNIEMLRTLAPGYSAMVPNTAFGLLLCGAALALDYEGRGRVARRLSIQVFAGMAALIGLATLIQYALGRDVGIDGLLFSKEVMRLAPGRMAIMSAAAFVLLGGGLATSLYRRAFDVGQYMVIAAGGLCLFNVIGYLYGIRSFYKLAFEAGSTAMAIHASVTLVILCAGALHSRPVWGFMATITSQAPGGIMARRLLPAAILIPIAAGWMQWQAQLKGYFDNAFGLTMLTSANIVVFVFLIWRSGQILNRLDIGRARAERNMRQLADSMPQMVWTADINGENDFFNQRCYDYNGMTFEETRDGGWLATIHPDDRQQTLDRRTRAIAAREPYTMEYRLRRASDGMYRWHLAQGVPDFPGEGNLPRWIGVCTDIHGIKLAEAALRRSEAEIRLLNESLEERVRGRTAELDRSNQQLARANEELHDSSVRLERSNRELHDFASVASHDLQEPLRKVQAFGDRLNTVCRDAIGEQGRDYLDRMLNASKRMQSLIQDLLKFARVTSQAQPFLPVDLAQVTREVLSDLEVRIAETNARVEVGDLPTIEADGVQMRQLIQNLIGNALKFHQEGRPPIIRVYVETPEDGKAAEATVPMSRLVVEDNGIGFDERYLDRIFTVFQRLHGRNEYEGTGVGLAICRKIAQRHGGDITAKSVPGQGSAFLVAIPFHHDNENSPLEFQAPERTFTAAYSERRRHFS